MKRNLFIATVITVLVTGCNTHRYKKLNTGLEYTIYEKGGTEKVQYGDFVKFRAYQYYNDSLMTTPFDTVAQLLQLDSMRMPGDYVRIFLMGTNGDSIITRILTDSVAKMGGLPPYAKPNNYLGYHFVIIDAFSDTARFSQERKQMQETMRKADSMASVKQVQLDDKTIQEYLEKNNIQAEKTPEGTYVQVIEKGSGEPVKPGSPVSVLYKGMLLDGTIFDQSYDSTGQPRDPFTFIVGQMGAISGWSDGMVYFNEGGKGKLFIPSGRAYGTKGAGSEIAPNTPLMFEVEIVDVLTQEQYEQAIQERRKKMMEMQQQRMEEMRKQQQPQKEQADSGK